MTPLEEVYILYCLKYLETQQNERRAPCRSAVHCSRDAISPANTGLFNDGFGCHFFWVLSFCFLGYRAFRVWNDNAEQLVLEGRTILCTLLAGALGAYLRIAFNLPAMRANNPIESNFVATIQVLSGSIVGLFLYVVVKSKVLLRVLYIGDISTITLDWEGAVALSLFAGLAANEIVSSVIKGPKGKTGAPE
jgi:hypothetical protein